MKLHVLALCLYFSILSLKVAAVPKCDDGYQPRGEVCVTQHMSDFLQCVEAIGGNKQQLNEEIYNTAKDAHGGSLSGSGSGAIVSGSGSIKIDSSQEKAIVRKLEERFFPGGLEECRKALDSSAGLLPDPYPLWRTDYAMVGDFIAQRANSGESPPQGACDGSYDYTKNKVKVTMTKTTFTMVVDTMLDRSCSTSNHYQSHDHASCTVQLADLDEAMLNNVGFTSETAFITLQCLAAKGVCARCVTEMEWKDNTIFWKKLTTQNDLTTGLRLPLGGIPFPGDTVAQLNPFLRALARLITAGSDDRFCHNVWHRCA